jgi:fatty-acyl-CoA synthase
MCTGGTTGAPKAVLWRQADIYVSGTGGHEGATAESIAASVVDGGPVWFATPPLMRAAAQWTAFSGPHAGAAVVLPVEGRSFDARSVLVERREPDFTGR